ncbi:YqiJ family protein [Sphingoaurantiacus capsulatus]|uniref:YqiJ family protein n=1 Tax=Sphingoaurantiacus capsulatus TaxID=1771310 RepID=A0ABV7XBZ3_9SPHN
MLNFLLAPENIAFSAALLLMLLIGIVEVVGLGTGAVDLEADGLDHGWLGWLGIGRLPLLMVIVVALASFGVTGLILQQLATGAAGALLAPWIAVPAAAAASLPVTSLLARGIARIMPRDETTAVSLSTLVGRRATIVVGTATASSPARARAYDVHGQSHYILVEPNTADEIFLEGDEVLIVARETNHFRAVGIVPRAAVDLGAL